MPSINSARYTQPIIQTVKVTGGGKHFTVEKNYRDNARASCPCSVRGAQRLLSNPAISVVLLYELFTIFLKCVSKDLLCQYLLDCVRAICHSCAKRSAPNNDMQNMADGSPTWTQNQRSAATWWHI